MLMPSPSASSPAALAALPDEELLESVQRQTFRFFSDASHPFCGLAPDCCPARKDHATDLVAIGGSGFGVMALIVAVERGWVTRAAALERLQCMLDVLVRATCYHGVFPHFMNGRTGATIPFTRKDDGGDLVETSFLFMGLLCARQYFNRGWYDYTGFAADVPPSTEVWARVIHPEDEPRAAARWSHCRNTGEPYEIEFRLRRHDGVYHWF